MEGGSGVNDHMKEISKFICRVKRRMGWNKWLQLLFQWLIAAALVDVILSVIALFVPWYEVTYFMAVVLGIGFVGSVIAIIVTYPSNQEAALTADAHGAKESLITAYEMKEKTDAFSLLQRKQAFKFVCATSPKDVIKIRLKWKFPGIFAGICCLAIGILFIPTTAKEMLYLFMRQKRHFRKKKRYWKSWKNKLKNIHS